MRKRLRNLITRKNMTNYLYAVLIAVALLAAIYLIIAGSRKAKRKTQQLKADYDQALRAGDKKKALEVGRNYYASMRSNKTLTIYDEQALTNDINTMQ